MGEYCNIYETRSKGKTPTRAHNINQQLDACEQYTNPYYIQLYSYNSCKLIAVHDTYRHQDISISSFGANCQLNCKMNVAMINLLTNDGHAIPLSVKIVPCIATSLQNTTSISVTHLTHLQNLQLTHSISTNKNLRFLY